MNKKTVRLVAEHDQIRAEFKDTLRCYLIKISKKDRDAFMHDLDMVYEGDDEKKDEATTRILSQMNSHKGTANLFLSCAYFGVLSIFNELLLDNSEDNK